MVEKIDIAGLYNDLAEAMQQESKEFKSIMKEVKKAAAQGKFSTRVEVDEDTYDCVHHKYTKQRTDLAKELEDAGFKLSYGSRELKFFGGWRNYIFISWRKD